MGIGRIRKKIGWGRRKVRAGTIAQALVQKEVGTLASKLSILDLNPDPAINCHPVVSQAG